MNDKFKGALIGIGITLILVVVFYLTNKDRFVKEVVNTKVEYVDRYYKPEKEYKFITIPQNKIYFFTDTMKVEKIKFVDRDIIRIEYRDSSKYDIYKPYLTQYPGNHKLIQMLLDGRRLDMTFLNTQGEVFQEKYKINTNLYSYNFVDNKMTQKRTPFFQRFGMFTQMTVRPIHLMFDLELGLKYNTSNFNYELGLSGFYYPRLPSYNLGSDVFIRLRYNF